MKILVTGSAGFIAGYLVEDLLNHGHIVYGIDNYSKYGKVEKSYDQHKNYHFVEGDAKDAALLKTSDRRLRPGDRTGGHDRRNFTVP